MIFNYSVFGITIYNINARYIIRFGLYDDVYNASRSRHKIPYYIIHRFQHEVPILISIFVRKENNIIAQQQSPTGKVCKTQK